MDDLKPFVHGSEGTHSACEKIVERGAKLECCGCSGHKCKDNEDDEETECPECGGELIKGKCKNWLDFLKNETGNKKSKQERIKNIQAYVEKYLSRELTYEEIEKICPDEIIKYERYPWGQPFRRYRRQRHEADSEAIRYPAGRFPVPAVFRRGAQARLCR